MYDFCDSMDCSPSGSSVLGIIQARILEWVAIPFLRGSSQPRGWTWSPTLQADSLLSEPLEKPLGKPLLLGSLILLLLYAFLILNFFSTHCLYFVYSPRPIPSLCSVFYILFLLEINVLLYYLMWASLCKKCYVSHSLSPPDLPWLLATWAKTWHIVGRSVNMWWMNEQMSERINDLPPSSQPLRYNCLNPYTTLTVCLLPNSGFSQF